MDLEYKLEKTVWDNSDFEVMGWHDSTIYQSRLTNDLEFDIDYILKWNKPELEGFAFTFWVAPATLVFRQIKNLTFDLDHISEQETQIDYIERVITKDATQWTIETQNGYYNFFCENFQQFIRQEPFFQFGQTIPYIERRGISLEQTTNQDNPNRFRADIVEQREKDLAHYENAKKRHIKRQEKEELYKQREENKIDSKQFLLKKKEIKEMLDYYDYWLKGTRFQDW